MDLKKHRGSLRWIIFLSAPAIMIIVFTLNGSPQVLYRILSQIHSKETFGYELPADNNNTNIIKDSNAILRKHGEKKKRLPQAIIAGVQKCGTGALRMMLGEHPQIVAHPDELHFFDKNYASGLQWYQYQMPETYQDQITMEKTPSYFETSMAHQRIHDMNSSIKLILTVKDPALRVLSDYSQYVYARYPEHDVKTFEQKIFGPDGEVDPSKNTASRSMYAKHTKELLELFKRDQLLVVDGHYFIKDPVRVLKRIEKFLNLVPWFSKDTVYFNEERGFYCTKNRCMPKYAGRKYIDVNPKLMTKLRRFFAPHNQIFYDLIGHDFGWPTA